MRAVVCWIVVAVAVWPRIGHAQEPPSNPEELRKLYQDSIEQLKAAQDRKAELAAENERLAARVAELERTVVQRDAAAAAWAEQTWFYRSHYAAWERFIAGFPRLSEQWRAFLQSDLLDPWDGHFAEPAVTRAE